MTTRTGAAVGIAMFLALFAAPLHAQRSGKPFMSPLKNFSVEVPNFTFGTKIQKNHDKQGGMVSFTGDLGGLQRIDYRRLPAGTIVPADPAALQAFLRNALTELLQSNPSSLLSEAPLGIDDRQMLLALVSFPGGSHLQDMKTNKRMDSLRAISVFTRGDFLYLLHVELTSVVGRPGASPPTPEELRRRAEVMVPNFYRTIVFM